MAVGILSALVLLIAVGGSPQAAQRASAKAADTLLFARDGAIWTARSSGADARQVVQPKLNPENASAAAETDRMVFEGRLSRPHAKRWIYVQALDGTHRRRLSVDGYDTRISPDGRTVMFGDFSKHRLRTYTAPVKGGPATELFDSLGGDNRDASFMRDGRILFVHDDDDVDTSVYVADSDGSDPQLLIPGDGEIKNPRYPVASPDGERIALVAAKSKKQKGADVWVVGFDPYSPGPANLTGDSVFDAFPVFSPDGEKIAWLRQTGDPHISTGEELWVMDADGSNQHRVFDDADYGPISWR
jgi:Tol biopolymer transport system component